MESIDDHTGVKLLRMARAAITTKISGEPNHPMDDSFKSVTARRGVFVTLRKSGQLRGCIGTFTPNADLPETIAEMAMAATQDPRFVNTPISASELKDIRIELSILSPLERMEDPLSFELRRHGIHLKQDKATGCFLPDVGANLGWDKKTFLSELCRQKAGLSPDAWRSEQTEIYRFTVQKFVE